MFSCGIRLGFTSVLPSLLLFFRLLFLRSFFVSTSCLVLLSLLSLSRLSIFASPSVFHFSSISFPYFDPFFHPLLLILFLFFPYSFLLCFSLFLSLALLPFPFFCLCFSLPLSLPHFLPPPPSFFVSHSSSFFSSFLIHSSFVPLLSFLTPSLLFFLLVLPYSLLFFLPFPSSHLPSFPLSSSSPTQLLLLIKPGILREKREKSLASRGAGTSFGNSITECRPRAPPNAERKRGNRSVPLATCRSGVTPAFCCSAGNQWVINEHSSRPPSHPFLECK